MPMTDTLGDWLQLREAADWAARSDALTRTIAARMPHDTPVRVLDLATGTGSNLRYLAERLPPRQDWLVVDQSTELLSLVAERTVSWATARGHGVQARNHGCSIHGEHLVCDVETRAHNLHSLDDETLFAGRDLVTASALLDLVSEGWLRALAARCRAAEACALFTISYDGRSVCTPAEPEDDLVLQLFNQHQRTDKGLGGPAAGPVAHALAARCFTDLGYEVRSERSDWILEAGDHELQRTLIAGWAEAATEAAPDDASVIAGWLGRRLTHVTAGCSRVLVGHRDMAAWLPTAPAAPAPS